MKNYTRLSDIREDISEGVVSCADLVEHYLKKIDEQAHLNAFLEVYADEARQQAKAVDQKLQDGTAGKLAGMVVGLKDVICHKDHRVGAASKILEGFNSLFNATATQRLLHEDAIIIGRLNCDEFAMGSSNENSAYGQVLNAQDTSKVPGGSSGGSAVAVQAGLCHATLGTDTGGSIRQPASFTGTVGLKPTYGRVSRWGLLAYGSSFDQIGPFTNSVEDAALLLEVIAGPDEYDATVSTEKVQPYSELLQAEGPWKIAYFGNALEQEGVKPDVKAGTQAIIEKLKADGHTVEAVDFPYLDYIVPTYYVLSTAEASSNLARYDGVHYGRRSPESTNMDSVYELSRTEGFGPEVKRRIMLGTFVLSAGYYDAYYGRAQKVRRLIYERTRNILSDFDFILTPTTPSTAFAIGEKMDDPVEMYLADIFTVQANLTGLPAVSLPLGTGSDEMPYGIQLIANKFEEARLLACSKYMMAHKAQLAG